MVMGPRATKQYVAYLAETMERTVEAYRLFTYSCVVWWAVRCVLVILFYIIWSGMRQRLFPVFPPTLRKPDFRLHYRAAGFSSRPRLT